MCSTEREETFSTIKERLMQSPKSVSFLQTSTTIGNHEIHQSVSSLKPHLHGLNLALSNSKEILFPLAPLPTFTK